MKVRFDRDTLIAAITPAASIASIKNTASTIEGVLLECPGEEEGTCRVTAYDMEKGMRTSVPCTVEEPGKIVVKAQNLLQIIRALPNGEISVSVDENFRACIYQGKSSFEISVTPGEHFPQLPLLAGDRNYVMPQHLLRDVISRTIYAVGVNDQRAIFNGLYFKIENDRLLIVGCDGNRVAISHVQLPGEENPDASVIVPGRMLSEVMRMIKDTEDEMTVTLARKHIIFRIGEYVYFTRLIEGEYIDYKRLLPKSHETEVFVAADILRGALERATLVTEDKLGGNTRAHIKLEFEGNLLKLSSVSAGGSIYDEIPVAKTGADLVIGFNCRFLVEALRNAPASSDQLRLCLNNPMLGVTIEDASASGSKTYIPGLEGTVEKEEEVFLDYIMPIRMNK
ncbi:MAG: DNA polymerase III subunit beta [Clostridia bacterium]|nr:DNA polymerase III subunit beta [Clostridia bacterium]